MRVALRHGRGKAAVDTTDFEFAVLQQVVHEDLRFNAQIVFFNQLRLQAGVGGKLLDDLLSFSGGSALPSASAWA